MNELAKLFQNMMGAVKQQVQPRLMTARPLTNLDTPSNTNYIGLDDGTGSAPALQAAKTGPIDYVNGDRLWVMPTGDGYAVMGYHSNSDGTKRYPNIRADEISSPANNMYVGTKDGNAYLTFAGGGSPSITGSVDGSPVAITDSKVKAASSDTTPDYLTDKLSAGIGLAIETTGSGDQSIDIRYTGTYKCLVRVATTGPITLSGEQTIDGIDIVAGDRVLVWKQASTNYNGIYVASATAWSRAADMANDIDIAYGAVVYVSEGDTWFNMLFAIITEMPLTLGVSGFQFFPVGHLRVFANSSDTVPGRLNEKVTASAPLAIVEVFDDPGYHLDIQTALDDNVKLPFGTGDDMSIYYDGTNGYIKTDEVATSDLHLTCGTAKTLVLDTPVYEDIQFPIASGKVPAANYPTWETFTTNTSAYAFSVDDYIDLQGNEPPHSWVEGSAGTVHVHFALKTANSSGANRYAKFTVYMAIADVNGTWTEIGPYTAEKTIPNGAAALTHYLLDVGTATLTGYHIGSQIKPRVKRIAATGGTEYADDVYITQVGMHVQEDTLGSRSVSSK